MVRVARAATAWLRVVAVALFAVNSVSADCECGYSVTQDNNSTYIFTDLIESNFFTQDSIRSDKNWAVQKHFKQPGYKAAALGRLATLDNVVSNPLKDKLDPRSGGKNGGDPGLQLWVRSKVEDDTVKTSEVKTASNKLLFGSFRASIKLPTVNGTCGAFFFYLSDSLEIDMEFLSKQFVNETSAPVHLVVHSPKSAKMGGDAAKTDAYEKVELPFRPDEGFHEYRFDWTPEKVAFFADGKWMVDITQYTPQEAGSILLNHWSDGRVGWSGGPPEVDAVMTIGYFKAYFNTTDEKRTKEWKGRCVAPQAETAICEVPDQDVAPDPRAMGVGVNGFMFTEQANMTHGSNKKSAAVGRGSVWGSLVGAVVLVGYMVVA